MEKFLDYKIKNHKKLNKKILFLEYKLDNFFPTDEELDQLVNFYISLLKQFEEKIILILQINNVCTYDTYKIWEGVNKLKSHEQFFIDHIEKAFILIENSFAIELINNIIRIAGTKVDTILVKSIKDALDNLDK